MALVILRVLLTEEILFFISFNEGIAHVGLSLFILSHCRSYDFFNDGSLLI